MSTIEALTFDTGGTILNWHAGISAKLAEIGQACGVEADWAAITNTYRTRSLRDMTAGDTRSDRASTLTTCIAGRLRRWRVNKASTPSTAPISTLSATPGIPFRAGRTYLAGWLAYAANS
jgi:hypothetical protein